MGRVHQATRADDAALECLFPAGHRHGRVARGAGSQRAGLRGEVAGAGGGGGAGGNDQRQAAPVPRARPVKRRVRARHAGATVHVLFWITMNAPTSTAISSQLITFCAAGMLVFQLLLVVQRMLRTSIRSEEHTSELQSRQYL